MFRLTITCFVIILAVLLYRLRRKSGLPPGPRRLPFLGNALDIPVNDAWLLFSQWHKEHGSLVYIELFGQPAVIANTHRVAIDLLTRRARLYSDRPWNYVAGQLLSGGHSLPFMGFSSRWRSIRRAVQDNFRKSALVKYRPIQTLEAQRCVRSLLATSSLWERHVTNDAVSVIMSTVYGMPPTDETDSNVRAVTAHTDRLARALYPGTHLVETFPVLRHLPACVASWKRKAMNHFSADVKTFSRMFYEARHSNQDDLAQASFARLIADQVDDGAIDALDAAWLCSTVFAAGAETTSASLCWFILCMVKHEEIQTKAQDELDRVVGRNRAPSFRDMDELPYINAILKEVTRWRPPLPLGLPHRLSTEDVYDGYALPRNTMCIPNIWQINHDPDVWGLDADSFRPERHLTLDGSPSPFVLGGHDDCHTTFGLGQRICPGRFFAAETLYITCATILWACRIRPPVDDLGVPILPSDYDHTKTGMTMHPAPFHCRFEARFEGVLQAMQPPDSRDLD